MQEVTRFAKLHGNTQTRCKDNVQRLRANEFDTIWFDNISRLRMMKVNTSIEVKSRKVHHRPLIR